MHTPSPTDALSSTDVLSSTDALPRDIHIIIADFLGGQSLLQVADNNDRSFLDLLALLASPAVAALLETYESLTRLRSRVLSFEARVEAIDALKRLLHVKEPLIARQAATGILRIATPDSAPPDVAPPPASPTPPTHPTPPPAPPPASPTPPTHPTTPAAPPSSAPPSPRSRGEGGERSEPGEGLSPPLPTGLSPPLPSALSYSLPSGTGVSPVRCFSSSPCHHDSRLGESWCSDAPTEPLTCEAPRACQWRGDARIVSRGRVVVGTGRWPSFHLRALRERDTRPARGRVASAMPSRHRFTLPALLLSLPAASLACTRQPAPSFFLDTPLLRADPPAPDTMPGDPGPLDRREVLRLGPLAGRAVISTDRGFVAYLDPAGRVHAARCTGDTPGEISLNDLPPASALAFEPGTSILSFAHDNTWVRRVDLANPDEREKWTVPVEGAQGAAITGLEVSAHGRIAWSTGATQRAGLIDAASGDAIATFTDAGSPVVPIPETCRVRFDPTGAYAVLTRELPTGPLMLTILDAASGRERTSHLIYVSMREPGFAFVAGGVAFGWRDPTPRDPAFRVMHLDLATSTVRVIDPDADAAHFISLLASPNGERLARADFGVNQLTLWEASTGLVPRREHPLRLCDTLGWDDSGAMLWMQRRAISSGDAGLQNDTRTGEGVYAFDPDTGYNLGPLGGLTAPTLRHVLRITGGPRTPLIVEWDSTSGETFLSVLWLKPSR